MLLCAHGLSKTGKDKWNKKIQKDFAKCWEHTDWPNKNEG